MVSLICIDVDGTLVGRSGEVKEDIWQTVERVRAAGMKLALCSGRPAFGKARGYAERLEPNGWHIFQNGASIVHVKNGQSGSVGLPKSVIGKLVERSRLTGRILELYTDSNYVVERKVRRIWEHMNLLGVQVVPGDLLSVTGQIVRAQWLVPLDEAAQLGTEDLLGLSVSPADSPVMRGTMFVSLTAKGIDKASAVKTVAEAYGIPLSEVMMVGDGHNDAVAMQAVGHGVAMGNASSEALDVADVVVGHVDEGGLIEALELGIWLRENG